MTNNSENRLRLDLASASKKPVLYLDWDGVVNFFGSRNQYRKRSGFHYLRRGSAMPIAEFSPWGGNGFAPRGPFSLNWSAELLRKLAELPVDIVALTTWRHSFTELIKATQWELESFRVLDWVDGPKGKEHAGKIPALIQDQIMNPRPFIWADDEAIAFYNDDHRKMLEGIPQLLLAPDEKVGLTMADYEAMLKFLASLGLNTDLDSDSEHE